MISAAVAVVVAAAVAAVMVEEVVEKASRGPSVTSRKPPAFLALLQL